MTRNFPALLVYVLAKVGPMDEKCGLQLGYLIYLFMCVRLTASYFISLFITPFLTAGDTHACEYTSHPLYV